MHFRPRKLSLILNRAKPMQYRLFSTLIVPAILLSVVISSTASLWAQDADPAESSKQEMEGAPQAALDPVLERGYYLARMGNCISCHTSHDGPEFGGGVPFHIAIEPF